MDSSNETDETMHKSSRKREMMHIYCPRSQCQSVEGYPANQIKAYSRALLCQVNTPYSSLLRSRHSLAYMPQESEEAGPDFGHSRFDCIIQPRFQKLLLPDTIFFFGI